MNLVRFLCLLLAVECMVVVVHAASIELCTGATLIDFDDLHVIQPEDGPGFFIPDGYKGLNWDTFEVIKSKRLRLEASLIPFKDGQSQKPPGQTVRGYDNGVISKPNIAVNSWGYVANISSDTPFNLCSLYVTAAYYNNVKITFTPFNGDTPGTPVEATINAENPTFVPLGFVGVTKVKIDPKTGNPYPDAFACPASKAAYPDWQYGYDWVPKKCGCHVALDNLAVDVDVVFG